MADADAVAADAVAADAVAADAVASDGAVVADFAVCSDVAADVAADVAGDFELCWNDDQEKSPEWYQLD